MDWKEKAAETIFVGVLTVVGSFFVKKGKPILKELKRMIKLTDEIDFLTNRTAATEKQSVIAEKRLRALLYSSPDPFIIKDKNGDVVFVNPAFIHMVGIRMGRDAFGVGFNRTLTKQSREDFENDKETFTIHPNSFEMIVEFEHEKTNGIIKTLCRSEPVEYDGVLVETILRFTILDKT